MNVVDSCGWLEYFANAANADFFAPAIEDVQHLIIPSLVIFEVSKRLRHLYGDSGEAQGMAFLEKGLVISGDFATMRLAARAAKDHRLAMADAIIWQTATLHQAQLFTQDAALRGLPGVQYQAKPMPALKAPAP